MKSLEGTGRDHGELRAYAPQRWRCDACGLWMDAETAHARWDRDGERFINHRIVHMIDRCCGPILDRDLVAVELLIGNDGLAMLLGFIASGSHDVGPVVDLIRRIHVSRFESVFPWFEELDNSDRFLHDPVRFMSHQEELEDMRRKLEAAGWPQPEKPSRYLLPGHRVASFRYRGKNDDEATVDAT